MKTTKFITQVDEYRLYRHDDGHGCVTYSVKFEGELVLSRQPADTLEPEVIKRTAELDEMLYSTHREGLED